MKKTVICVCALLLLLTFSNTARADCEKAKELFRKAMNSESSQRQKISFLEGSIKECPDVFIAHFELARAYIQANEIGDAEKAARDAEAKAVSPEDLVMAQVLLGQIYERKKEDYRAVVYVNNAYLITKKRSQEPGESREALEKVLKCC